MNACETHIRLSAYHDGELSPSERDAVAAHLASCPACTAELAAMATQSRQLSSMALPRLSQMAVHRLHHSIDRAIASAAEQGMLRIARVLGAVAAGVLVVGSAWLSFAPQRAAPAVAPPWTGVAFNSESEAVANDITTPAAQWYLADAEYQR